MLGREDTRGLSVVLVHRGGQEMLERCLASLLPTLPPKGEVIVVDNNSPDDSVTRLRTDWPSIRVLEMGYNAGFAVGCNRGAAAAGNHLVVFLNNDTVVAEGWWQPLWQCLRNSPNVAIAGSLALFLHDPSTVNSAGTRVALSGAAVDVGFGLPRSSLTIEDREMPAVSGVCMAVDRQWFSATGGFDEDFFMYFEDVELSLRAWLEGREVRFVASSEVLHAFGGTSGRRSSPFRHRLASRNRLVIAFKLWPAALIVPAFAACLAQDALVVAHLALGGHFRDAREAARSKVNGTVEALRSVPSAIRFRQTFAKKSERSLIALYKRGLIDSPNATRREFIRMRRL